MTRCLCFSLLSFVLAGSVFADAGRVGLVARGKPAACIVIAQDAAGCVPLAAQELQFHLDKMSGAKLPVIEVDDAARTPLREVTQGKTAVLIGESVYTKQLGVNATGLKPDGFRIRSGDGWLALVGRDDAAYGWNFRWVPTSAGSLYGVYRFLEGLGVRWFYPTELGAVIPKTQDVSVRSTATQDEPYFAYRHSGYGDQDAFVWQRRLGAGGDRDVWSTMHTYTYCGFHKKFGKSHPEYFGVGRDGQRGTAVALAHPGVVEATVELARQRFRGEKLPGRKYFLVIPEDGRGCCQCPLCQSKLDRSRGPDGDMSDYVAEAAVKVAEALVDEFPDSHIVYCAYSRYQLAPREINRLPSNMVVLIAQPRARFYDEQVRRRAYDLLAAWRRLQPQAIYFCRYYNSMIKMTPSPAPHMIARDLKELKRLSETGRVKLKGEMNFCGVVADSPHAWWFQLNQYVTAKLLWNPDVDVDALLDDYCGKCYGPAARDMRRLIDRCEALYYDDEQRYLYRVETIDELEGLLASATQKAADTAYSERLTLVSRGFELLRQMRRKLVWDRTRPAPTDRDAGLVAYFPFEEGQGSLTRDVVSGKQGEIVNAKWTDGKFGRALELSGEESGVRLEPVSLADTDYTIMAWIRPAEIRFSGLQYLVGPTMWYRVGLRIRDSKLELYHRSPRNYCLASPPREFTDRAWVHVAGTFSRRNGMAVYLDGRLAALDTTATEPTKFVAAWLGASGDGSTADPNDAIQCFQGAIDEVRVYTRELSYREVLEHARRRPP